MTKRVIPTPRQQGSRTPEEIREVVRKVMAQRDAAAWTKVMWTPDPEPAPVADLRQEADSGSDEPNDQ